MPGSSNSDVARSYTGLRVVDLTTTIAGPYCGRLLADMGADVIKVEPPDGDMMRARPPLRNGASTMYGQLNAGKRSVVLDLKKPENGEALRKLIQGADIVVENYRPGVTKRLGIDFDTVQASNPRLIYCSISGFGQTGPLSDKPAYAPVVHANSGFDLAHLDYQPGRNRPDYCGIYVADVLSGTFAFGAIGTALHHRERTGDGQHIDVSMMEAMLSLSLVETQAAQFDMPPPPSRPLFGPTETADGYIMIAIASERTFHNLAAAANRPDWLEDPRFKIYLDRRRNWGDFMDEVEAWTRTLPTSDCVTHLEKHSVPATAYRTVRDALADPQIAHRNAFQEISDAGGTFRALNPPFQMSESETATGASVAALGAHTEEVLRELAET